MFLRPAGAFVHARSKSVNWRVVWPLAVAGMPAALLGAALGGHLGHQGSGLLRRVLGGVLLAAVAGGLLRSSRAGLRGSGGVAARKRGLFLLLGGLAGGTLGLSSVGAGSLTLAGLGLLAPEMEGPMLVGTDLAQGALVSLAAAVGAVAFGEVDWAAAGSLVAGGLPGVLAGSLLSSRLRSRWFRPGLAGLISYTALSYLGAASYARLGVAAVFLGLQATLVFRSEGAGSFSKYFEEELERHGIEPEVASEVEACKGQ